MVNVTTRQEIVHANLFIRHITRRKYGVTGVAEIAAFFCLGAVLVSMSAGGSLGA